jgi:hypothetical protein
MQPGTAHPLLLTIEHVTAAASAGSLMGAWSAGQTNRSLADFGIEISRLTSGERSRSRSGTPSLRSRVIDRCGIVPAR